MAFFIHQGAFINKIIAYMEMDAGAPLSEERKIEIKKGVCHGLSLVYSFMAATGKLAWWKQLLEMLADWNGSAEALKKEVILPNATEQNKTLSYLFKRAINYILYNQVNSLTALITETQQMYFLQAKGSFDSAEGKIAVHTAAAGYLDDGALRLILTPSIFSQKNTLFLVCSANHACTIRFDVNSNQWWYYDPNYFFGEKSFDNVSSLIKALRSTLGFSLSIQLASWKQDTGIAEFDAAFQQILTTQAVTLLREQGLYLIVKYAPKKIAELVALAEKKDDICCALATALQAQTIDAWTNLHMIARYAPDQLAGIIRLAENNDTMRNALAVALQTQSNDGWIGLHLIVRYAPAQLAQIIELAKNNDTMRNALAIALQTQSNDGWTGLHMIAGYTPAQLAQIIELAKNNDAMRNALAAALQTQNQDGWTGLHIAAGCSPLQLIKLLELDSVVLLSLVNALHVKNKQDDTALDYIRRHSSQANFAAFENLPKDIINIIIKLDQNGLLEPIIRTLWEKTGSNAAGFFCCAGDSDSKIAYRKIQKIFQGQAPSKERALSVMISMRQFAMHEHNQQNTFAAALKNKFRLGLITVDEMVSARGNDDVPQSGLNRVLQNGSIDGYRQLSQLP